MRSWPIVLIVLGGAACTVSLSSVPDAGCVPSPDFFVSDVWPRYLGANACITAGCHAFDDGHGYFRLRAPESSPAPGTPIAGWPIGWRTNYLSAIQLVRCDAPAMSRLLTVPEGDGNLHPPGPVVLDRTAAADVVTAWLRAP